jgi:tetrapyrrole methylase family protein/MazG family protein
MHFEKLIKIVEKLRSPEGCPWDREQTRETLKPFLIEELYEFLDTLDEDNPEGMKEELGDLLFQIVLQAQLSKEEGLFDINDVINNITQKMLKRHPHVFGEKDLKTSEEVLSWWKEHKKIEGKERESLMDEVPKTLPALLRAYRIQTKASEIGFDWENVRDVFKKLDEEIKELKNALNRKDKKEIEDEIGDIFFVLTRISSFVGVNPEDALRKTVNKFIQRFKYMEKKASEQGKRLSDMSLEEMDILWNEAKEKKSKI